ncbi:hypothetical protein [Roseiflexus sp.]|uniref:hypothetical protein n=1 Tax=Roseiflexus sp. TaxID=2562120 RepID=UPI00398B86E7
MMAKRYMTIGAALVVCLMIVLCGSGVGVQAFQRGVVQPPPFAVDLGIVQVTGRLSSIPICSYATSCLLDPSGRDLEIYTVWLLWRPGRADAPTQAIRLMSIVIDGS